MCNKSGGEISSLLNIPKSTVNDIWWREDYGVGLFFLSLVPVKGTLYASEYQEILDNSMLLTLWVGKWPLPLSTLLRTSAQNQVHKPD